MTYFNFEVKAMHRTDKGDFIAIVRYTDSTHNGDVPKRDLEKAYVLKREDWEKSTGLMKTWYGVVDGKLETDSLALEVLASGYLWFRYNEDR